MKLPWDAKTHVDKHDGGYHREASDPRYHTPRWTRLASRFRAEHPLCEECKRNGIIKAADCVDHIIPAPICEDFYDEKNLQSLCSHCNMIKGNKDKQLIQEWRRTHQ
jgi:5-methylcytosine-specific restriction endonuclease McrA